MDEEVLTKKRLSELYKRAFSRGSYEYSDFLNIYEQSLLKDSVPDGGYTLDGGYVNAERLVSCFGSEEEFGYPPYPPIVCIKISPRGAKFSEELTHRDFLGALMNLGIKREKLGDILLCGSDAYLFCIETVSDFICKSLDRVRHTAVECGVADCIPEQLNELPETERIVVSSERLDALISAVYKLSRAEILRYFAQNKVYVNGRNIISPDERASDGDIVSVRGLGRFIYCGMQSETKKGRLAVGVRIYK